MTRDALVQKITDDVQGRDTGNPSSAPLIGGIDKSVLDYIQPFKKIIVDLAVSFDGVNTIVTPTYIQDDFPTQTKNWSIPSNGILRCIGDVSSTWNIAGKTWVTPFVYDNSGSPGFGNGKYNLIGTPTYYLDISLRKFDGTQTGTPLITLRNVEITIQP